MTLLLWLAACRPDPGLPDYPEPEPWVPGGDDFYPDPLDPGEERLSIGLFYEGTATESVPVDDLDTHFYIYENTFSVETTDDRWEGYVADELVRGSLAWWGGGIHWDTPRDLSGWEALHLVVQSTDPVDWEVGITGGGVEARVAVADYGLVADDAWHEVIIPLGDFEGADLTTVTVALLLVGEGGEAGDRWIVDGVYYTRGGEG